MSNFLQQLRDKARERENQDATPQVPAVLVAEPEPVASAAPVHASPATVQESPTAPAASQAQTGLSFLARIARASSAAPAAAPAVPVNESGTSLLNDDAGVGEDEGSSILSADSADPAGLGDAPVNAATVVESTIQGDSNSGATLADLFRTRLAALDSLCQTESGITPLIHDQVKAHVKGIMVDLRENPEMRGLLLDKDMHNIMLFIQSSTQIQDTKVEKVAVKREKRAKTAAISGAFEDAFASLDVVPSLADLGNKSTDNIESKVR